MIEAEPECRGRRELGVAAADDAAGEQTKRRDEYDAAGGQMGKDIRRAHAADHRQRDEAADEDQRHPVGDGQGQEIARGSECHHRWEQRQPDRIGDHDHVVAAYLNASWTKVALSFEPSPCTTAMIATEMPAATRPYSTAVAPDSSFTKRFTRLIIFASTVHN